MVIILQYIKMLNYYALKFLSCGYFPNHLMGLDLDRVADTS